MPFNSRRWQAETIAARVRASTAISAADLDASERAERKLELLRVADGVDSGQISNAQAAAAFLRTAAELTPATATRTLGR